MGWIGWTEEQTLAMTPAVIALARDGRIDMINTVMRAVFPAPPGGTPDAVEPKAGLQPNRANWARVFGEMSGGAALSKKR